MQPAHGVRAAVVPAVPVCLSRRRLWVKGRFHHAATALLPGLRLPTPSHCRKIAAISETVTFSSRRSASSVMRQARLARRSTWATRSAASWSAVAPRSIRQVETGDAGREVCPRSANS